MSENAGGNAGDSSGGEGQAGESTNESNQQAQPKSPIDANLAEKLAKKYKVKVDNEELEVDEDELVRGYQMRKASDKRFQEGLAARKQSEEFIRLLKTDPKKVLAHPSIGLDLKKFAEDYLMEQLQDEMMDPKDKELREYKKKLSQFEEQEKLKKQKEDDEAKESVKKKYQEDYNRQIVEALDVSGLPKTEYTVERMIYYMHKALKNGYELDAKDVTDLVKRDYIEDSKALYSGLDGEALEKIMGSDIAKKLRKHDIDKLKQPKNNLSQPVDVKRNGRDEQPKSDKLSKDAWRKKLDSLRD
jgi:hypothetical protein